MLPLLSKKGKGYPKLLLKQIGSSYKKSKSESIKSKLKKKERN
jgi:hypothetical protein